MDKLHGHQMTRIPWLKGRGKETVNAAATVDSNTSLVTIATSGIRRDDGCPQIQARLTKKLLLVQARLKSRCHPVRICGGDKRAWLRSIPYSASVVSPNPCPEDDDGG